MQPIIVIEDDADDQDIIRLTLSDLKVKQEVVFFDNAESAIIYLARPDIIPFLILSDINMPGMNGFQLRDMIHADPDLRVKCIPYIFLTTGGESKLIWEAYSKNAQGFFVKPSSIAGWKELMASVFSYWGSSKKPHVG